MFCLETGALLLLYLSAIPVPESWSYRRTLWGCGFHNECDQTDQAGDSVPAQLPLIFTVTRKMLNLLTFFFGWEGDSGWVSKKSNKQASKEHSMPRSYPMGTFFLNNSEPWPILITLLLLLLLLLSLPIPITLLLLLLLLLSIPDTLWEFWIFCFKNIWAVVIFQGSLMLSTCIPRICLKIS